MNLSEACLRRPIATLLFWISSVVAGAICWLHLPISALPKYETPTIAVSAQLPGASPETIAASVATPLERQFSAIPGLLTTTSSSILGETEILLAFDSSRSIDAAAGDVQAAISRVSGALPAEMQSPPAYRKVNPGDAAILAIAVSSPSLSFAQLNAYSDNLIVPRLAAVRGVAQIQVTGQKRYAVRIQADPAKLAAIDLTLDEVAVALQRANSNLPLGQLDNRRQWLTVHMDGQLLNARDFSKVIVATRLGKPVRLTDVASVTDSIEDLQNTSAINGRPCINLFVYRQPDGNTVAMVDSIQDSLERLRNELPASVKLEPINDRSTSIRNSIRDVNRTILLTIGLVVLTMLLFLRRLDSTLIPSLSVPVSLLSTFALMYLIGLSLDNISLLGLAIAVGLVVDDAIVVLEASMAYVERGMTPASAAIQASKDVGFTVVSISLSLVAVFIPIFFMPGTVGLVFHEFATVVCIAILVSAVVALTLIPTLVPMLMSQAGVYRVQPKWSIAFERGFERALAAYVHVLELALAWRASIVMLGIAMFGLSGWLYVTAPKGFFPQEDTGQVVANASMPDDMSYSARLALMQHLQGIVMADKYVANVVTRVDNDTNKLTMDLVDRASRPELREMLGRLRKETSGLPGIQISFSAVQSLRLGLRATSSTYQYTLQSVSPSGLDDWSERLVLALRTSDVLVDVTSDLQKKGLDARVSIDRDKAAQLGVDIASIHSALYASFGGRQVTTILAPEDSYQVILEVANANRRDENDILAISVRGSGGKSIPLSSIAEVTRAQGVISVAHQGQLPAVTLSFDLAPGKSLSDAFAAIKAAETKLDMPATVFGEFGGQAQVFEQTQTAQLWLVLAAVAVIYVILGMLYESWMHPLTILLGIPSATAGALIALRVVGMEVDFMAMIGILLLIGIVKKNAIMMIDYAVVARRERGLSPSDAIRQACVLRFRPIMMTTMCAMVGVVPIALGLGAGGELRQPLGVAVIGGLMLSQLVTLFLTPVLYILFERAGVDPTSDLAKMPVGIQNDGDGSCDVANFAR